MARYLVNSALVAIGFIRSIVEGGGVSCVDVVYCHPRDGCPAFTRLWMVDGPIGEVAARAAAVGLKLELAPIRLLLGWENLWVIITKL